MNRHFCWCLTFLITAAPGWAADTPNVAAAILGAALAPAYSYQQEEDEATKDDEEYCEPVCGRNGERKRILMYLGAENYEVPLHHWRNLWVERKRTGGDICYPGNRALALTQHNELNFFVWIA